MAISFQQFMILAEAEGGSSTDFMGFSGSIRSTDRASRAKRPEDRKRKTWRRDPETGKLVQVTVVPKPYKKSSGENKTATAKIGEVDRTVSPEERAKKAAEAAKAERAAAARARIKAKLSSRQGGGGDDSKPTTSSSSKDAEKKATELLQKDAQQKKAAASGPAKPKRTYKVGRTDANEPIETGNQRVYAARKARRQEVAALKKKILADMMAKHEGPLDKKTKIQMGAEATKRAEKQAGVVFN